MFFESFCRLEPRSQPVGYKKGYHSPNTAIETAENLLCLTFGHRERPPLNLQVCVHGLIGCGGHCFINDSEEFVLFAAICCVTVFG